MKYLLQLALLVSILSIFTLLPACEEVPPAIDLTEPEEEPEDTHTITIDTSDAFFLKVDSVFESAEIDPVQEQIVLIEEFTGVRCVNCPKGHDIAADLIEQNDGRVLAMALHAGFLTTPYPESTQEFAISEAQAIHDYTGTLAVPSASINRTVFDGEQQPSILNVNAWGGKVAQALTTTPPVNLYVYKEYNPETRQLSVWVQLRYTQTVLEPNYITVAISEGGIIDPQLVPDGASSKVELAYEHNHVMRDLLTSNTGDLVDTATNVRTVYIQSFSKTLPTDWDAQHCEVIAYVHYAGEDKSILQAGSVYVEDE